MAEGLANALGQGKLEVYSSGSRPSPEIDPLVTEVMKEKLRYFAKTGKV